ncbi:aminotransferase class III-fold pyridoxal phosphate-dependent enzyme [Sediminicola luteus]|uniref:Peptidase M23 n=1 Tax=Sediminicola luteus TaxID=319238 RepID=A0A2A4G8A6_9FLAO|nr:aminotransferase class III-fold pyridoxal phosphate-dependent enzyme [Sediminicola luteus]PCE63985.1 peptidase M23 [Sediminicola luteus]
MNNTYQNLYISESQAQKIAQDLFGITAEAKKMPGEIDFNFKLDCDDAAYLLKVSRPEEDLEYLHFQQALLEHVNTHGNNILAPKVFIDTQGASVAEYTDEYGKLRYVRLLSWVDGRVWSSVNPITSPLLESLGEEAGKLTATLTDFDHPKAHRDFVWDISQMEWTLAQIDLFEGPKREIIAHFQQEFLKNKSALSQLRQAVVHNDANDNNVVVSDDLVAPVVRAIIDYGDAVYTAQINDLAVTLAYALMDKPDPLEAARAVIKGYHKSFPLEPKELELLHVLVAARLVISVTKSALNKQLEPDNSYHQISERPAWEVLEKWIQIPQALATAHFRVACGLEAHPNAAAFRNWAQGQNWDIHSLLPGLNKVDIYNLDLSVGSTWLGAKSNYESNDKLTQKLKELQHQNPKSLICGGYSEARPFYSTEAYKTESNSGPSYRTMHLGMDFWAAAQSPVHSPMTGTVFSLHNNANDKDYGPTLILEHQAENGPKFYTLYGHLSLSSLTLTRVGQTIDAGQLIGYMGNETENGNWSPHLHFQLVLDLLGNQNDFPGVALPQELELWSTLSPDPNLLFKQDALKNKVSADVSEILSYRKQHLGKSLSVSYKEPLHIVRGDGPYLIDAAGQKYLDTVNNVAHVGHEHPAVVKAGTQQMALLNTNTRYLHGQITEFAQELLATFPPELSVVHFVNSGSEANELALRMAYTVTGQKDIIASEIGYHGNTNGCIGISSYKFDGKGGAGAPEHTHIVPLVDAFRGKYRGDDTTTKYAQHVQHQLNHIQEQGRNVAAFIYESIISCGGQIELPEGYLEQAYAMVRKAGGLCISDEVQVGCGRVGKAFWGFQLHNVIPDIVTIGKPLGNGHPLAAVVCTQKVAEGFANGMEYFNTFGGNPVSCAIGTAVLRTVKEEGLQQQAQAVGDYLKEGLKTLQADFPIIGDIRGQGLFLGFELNGPDLAPLAPQASYLANRMKTFGILMSTDGLDHNVLKIKPPLVFNQDHADELLLRLRTVCSEDFMQHQH